MKKKNVRKGSLAILLTMLLVFGLMPVPAFGANSSEYTVFVSVEGFNLGYGFFIEPTAVTVPAGSTAMDATRALFEQTGHEYSPMPWGGIGRIYGIHPGGPANPPPYITIEMEDGPDDGSLGGDDYTPGFSGWMFTVNHNFAPVGPDEFLISDGDVLRWQFTVEGWGADLGLCEERGAFGEPLYDHVDKSDLIRGLFTEGASNEAIQAALAVIIDPLATAEAVALALSALQAQDAGNYVTVFVSFEGFNLGHGFYIEPTAVNVPSGSTAIDATIALLNQAGYEFSLTPWGGLDRIEDIHPGEVNPPAFITIELEQGPNDGSVGSFDYTENSGWMYTINHFMAPVGADALIVFNGDVLRWQFTIEGWGADLGLGPDWGTFAPGLYEHADKSELIRGMFAQGANTDALQDALDVIINPLATAADVAAAFAALDLPSQTTDRASLRAAISEGAARQREIYVPEDAQWDPPFWGVLQTALNAAQVVSDNPNATQLAIDGAAERLWTAIDALVPLQPDESEPNENEPDEADEPDETVTPPTWANPFIDVSTGDWFYGYVQFVFENGLMTGTTPNSFSPDMGLSRGMAVTLLWRLAGYPTGPDIVVFDDLRPGQWYYYGASWAGANNIIGAYAGESFGSGHMLTGEQFADILVAYGQLIGFDDLDAVSQIFTATELDRVVTRGAAAAIIQRFIELVG